MIQTTQTDHRWFIWTIVFLLVSGVSLVSYIMITSINEEAQSFDQTTFMTIQKR